MIFHNDTVPSSPDALHALLRQLAFVDEPQEFGTSQAVEESRATSEMKQMSVPESSSLPSTSIPETSAIVRNEEHMTPAMLRSEHPDWFRPREERKQHRRRFTPPDFLTGFKTANAMSRLLKDTLKCHQSLSTIELV